MLKRVIGKYKNIPVQMKAAIWFLVCSILQKGISTITTPIFTRLMSTTEYGEYSVFNSWLSIITVFVSLKMYNGVYVQGLVKFEDIKNKYTSSLQGLTVTLVCAWTGIYLLLHNQLNAIFALTTSQMLAMLLLIWSTAVFSFWAAEQRVIYRYKKLVILTVMVSILKPVVGIILLISFPGNKVLARIWGLTVVEFVCYFGLFITQMKNGKVFFSHSIWKYALTFSIPLIPHYLSQTILNTSDRIMIQKLVGPDKAGIYSLAYSISLLMMLINSAMLQTVNPWIYRKIKTNTWEDIAKVAYSCLILIAGANLFLICFTPEIVNIFAPAEYNEAIWIIPPVAMSVFFNFAYSLFANFEFYYEKTKFIALSTGIAAILNIILNYVFIKLFGYYAAGYTTLFSYMVYAIMHYVFMNKICREQLGSVQIYNSKILIGISISFMGIGTVISLFYSLPVLRYFIVILFCIITFIKRNWIKKLLRLRNP